jgi:hypothetical protein
VSRRFPSTHRLRGNRTYLVLRFSYQRLTDRLQVISPSCDGNCRVVDVFQDLGLPVVPVNRLLKVSRDHDRFFRRGYGSEHTRLPPRHNGRRRWGYTCWHRSPARATRHHGRRARTASRGSTATTSLKELCVRFGSDRQDGRDNKSNHFKSPLGNVTIHFWRIELRQTASWQCNCRSEIGNQKSNRRFVKTTCRASAWSCTAERARAAVPRSASVPSIPKSACFGTCAGSSKTAATPCRSSLRSDHARLRQKKAEAIPKPVPQASVHGFQLKGLWDCHFLRDRRSKADLASWLTRDSIAPFARVWTTSRAPTRSRISIDRSRRS